MSPEFLKVTQNQQTLEVTIHREQVLNAVNRATLSQLSQTIDSASQHKKYRALVLRGQGTRSFIGGADIGELQSFTEAEALAFSRLGQKVTQQLEAAPFLTIAVVQGYALGAGCELALACDMIIAGEEAVFGLPEVGLGLIPGLGGTQRLARRIGQTLAIDILCTGRTLSAHEAHDAKLVCRVVPNAQLEKTLAEIIQKLALSGPRAITETKKLVRDSLDCPLEYGLERESLAFSSCLGGQEGREGLQAFIDKRKPTFSV